MYQAIINPKEFVERCIDQGIDLLSEIRTLNCSKEDAFVALKVSVFDGVLMKADIFYAFGTSAIEFEAVISQLTTSCIGNFVSKELLEEEFRKSNLVYPFNSDDFSFYLACRDCFPDFQALVSNIERNIWWGTYATLLQSWGTNWIIEVDKKKRAAWSQIREDFRIDHTETALFEFCSIPDLRDIITSTKHWPYFTKHLPKEINAKTIISESFNKLILTRNKIFHPTRNIGPSYTEFCELKYLLAAVSIARWRELNVPQLSKLLGSGPELKWY